MRYFGTITGNIIDKSKQKIYRECEEPEYWDSYYAEVINVYDDAGNKYDRLLIKATLKTAIHLMNYIIHDNSISFDCKEISNDIIIRKRNICTSNVGIGNYPYKIVNFIEYNKMSGNNLGCINCTYRNKKSECLTKCVLERR